MANPIQLLLQAGKSLGPRMPQMPPMPNLNMIGSGAPVMAPPMGGDFPFGNESQPGLFTEHQRRGEMNMEQVKIMRDLVAAGYAEEEDVGIFSKPKFKITDREGAIRFLETRQTPTEAEPMPARKPTTPDPDIRPFPHGPLGPFPGAELPMPGMPGDPHEPELGPEVPVDPDIPVDTGEPEEVEVEKKGGLGWKGLLAIAAGTGVAAAVGGKDFRRGLAGGLTQLGPNLARARVESEKMEFRREQAAALKEYRGKMVSMKEREMILDFQGKVALLQAARIKTTDANMYKLYEGMTAQENALRDGEATKPNAMRNMKILHKTLGVDWTLDQEGVYDLMFSQYGADIPKGAIGPTQRKDMAKARLLWNRAAEIKTRIMNPEVRSRIGLLTGTVTEWKDWYYSEGEVPESWRKVFLLLGFERQDFLRLKTGAAATDAENRFFDQFIGTMALNYTKIDNRMDILLNMLNDEINTPLIMALKDKYRGIDPATGLPTGIPEDVMATLPQISYGDYYGKLLEQVELEGATYESKRAIEILRGSGME
jgi:hypothetical protein